MQTNNDLDLLLKQRTLIEGLQKIAIDKKIPVVGKNTGYLLESTVRLLKPSNILEVGCGNGFSSYFILKGMAKDSKYFGIDMNRRRLDGAKKLIDSEFPDLSHKFFCGNAMEIITGFTDIFDLVFIDAAKYEYARYLDVIIKKIRKGTLIIADDVLCKDNIFLENPRKHYINSVEGLKGYLRAVGPGSMFETSILDIDGGLAFSIYRGR